MRLTRDEIVELYDPEYDRLRDAWDNEDAEMSNAWDCHFYGECDVCRK